jgi:hypothetical protein
MATSEHGGAVSEKRVWLFEEGNATMRDCSAARARTCPR